MTRVIRGTGPRKRKKKLVYQAKGFVGSHGNILRTIYQQIRKAHSYSFRDRRNRKRYFRSLWIQRINAQVRQGDSNMVYSRYIAQLKKNGSKLHRKSLSQLAIYEPAVLAKLISYA
jgi:large subunit ribosomal protein L20